MAKYKDKVKSADVVAKWADGVALVNFVYEEQNGFFCSIVGKKVLQFSTKQQAQDAVTDLNAAVAPILARVDSAYTIQMQAIINA